MTELSVSDQRAQVFVRHSLPQTIDSLVNTNHLKNLQDWQAYCFSKFPSEALRLERKIFSSERSKIECLCSRRVGVLQKRARGVYPLKHLR